jgi:nicotinamide mononucleotide transporter
MVRIRWYEWGAMALASLVLILFSLVDWLRWDEVLGFITGGICVWLAVRQHSWNWPIGLANNVLFFVIFLRSRLYADMSLQVVFFALGVYGWWNWVRRGPDDEALRPRFAGLQECLAVVAFVVAATFGIEQILISADGASPFWDALTTSISLGAQYLLSRKRIENWGFWILADVIYVPLYFDRGLPLTGVLYGIFLVMCVVGLMAWLRAKKESERTVDGAPPDFDSD